MRKYLFTFEIISLQHHDTHDIPEALLTTDSPAVHLLTLQLSCRLPLSTLQDQLSEMQASEITSSSQPVLEDSHTLTQETPIHHPCIPLKLSASTHQPPMTPETLLPHSRESCMPQGTLHPSGNFQSLVI